MGTCRISAKTYLRKLNSKQLAEMAATDGEYSKLAKAEIERRKRKRYKKGSKTSEKSP